MVEAVASSTVHFSNDSGAWLIVAFMAGIMLAVFLAESFVDMADRRRTGAPISRVSDETR